MKKTLEKRTKKGSGETSPAQMEEAIRKAAYFRWLERGAPVGDDLNDWYEIENRWRDNIVPANND